MRFLLALIFYNASLQINIVPQCKDWSIFCFDLADDLVPCKTKSAKTRLENDRNDMDCWSPLITVDPQVKVWLFLSAYTVKMVSSDVRITGAVARQTDQTGLSTGRFNWNNGFFILASVGLSMLACYIFIGRIFVFKTCLISSAKV